MEPGYANLIGSEEVIETKTVVKKTILKLSSDSRLAKDYVKALRSRLQHKNPNVQLLSLTVSHLFSRFSLQIN